MKDQTFYATAAQVLPVLFFFPGVSLWARLDSNQRPTDYEIPVSRSLGNSSAHLAPISLAFATVRFSQPGRETAEACDFPRAHAMLESLLWAA
jgi:hypothetical protein